MKNKLKNEKEFLRQAILSKAELAYRRQDEQELINILGNCSDTVVELTNDMFKYKHKYRVLLGFVLLGLGYRTYRCIKSLKELEELDIDEEKATEE